MTTPTSPATPGHSLALAHELILRPAGLDESRIEQALGTVLGAAVDAADVYFQLSRDESWSLEDGIVKEGSASIEQGVGVRALAGEKTGFAYSDEIDGAALDEAARAARAIAAAGHTGRVPAFTRLSGHSLYLPEDPVGSLSDDDKVSWLERVDRETRRIDPRIVQVMASVSSSFELVLIATSDGTLAADARPLVRFNVSVSAEQNGRRESFAHMTLPRMTNTYMRPGPHDPGEIIASVERGIYAVNFGGGQVDITSGKFVFSASEAYLIENGRLGAPLKGATLIGNGPDVLTRVSMVGNDLKLDDGVGTCGKEGQSVPVGVGQPTLRIDALTVGGTGTA